MNCEPQAIILPTIWIVKERFNPLLWRSVLIIVCAFSVVSKVECHTGVWKSRERGFRLFALICSFYRA
jgi:hypothetical protein